MTFNKWQDKPLTKLNDLLPTFTIYQNKHIPNNNTLKTSKFMNTPYLSSEAMPETNQDKSLEHFSFECVHIFFRITKHRHNTLMGNNINRQKRLLYNRKY